MLWKRRLKRRSDATAYQDAELKSKAAKILRDIDAWAKVRTAYVVIADDLEAEATERRTAAAATRGRPLDALRTWDRDLWLPSQVPSDKRIEGCADGLPLMELRMRIAAAEATVVKWRNARRYRAHLVQQLYGNTAGERAITRQLGLLLGVENTVTRLIEEYRAHRAACVSLAPLDLSHKHLLEFKDSDNTGPIPDLDEVRLERQARKTNRIGPNASRTAQANALHGLLPGQGQRISSWPWRMYRPTPDSVAQMAHPSCVTRAGFRPNMAGPEVCSDRLVLSVQSSLTIF
jgi:hypothetical protein